MKTEPANCLNCGSPADKNYCPQCGQKQHTHRLSIGHFILHDMLHGIWHLDKGIPFTLKEILIRPGFVAREYIEGKRAKYFNFFSLLILTIALNFFIHGLLPVKDELQGDLEQFRSFFTFLQKNGRLFLFLLLPFMAFWTFVLFRKMHYNYTEHLVPTLLVLTVSLILDLLCSLGDYFMGGTWIDDHAIVLYLILAFGIFTYWQFTGGTYSIMGFAWRILLAFLLFFFIIILLLYFGQEYWNYTHEIHPGKMKPGM